MKENGDQDLTSSGKAALVKQGSPLVGIKNVEKKHTGVPIYAKTNGERVLVLW